MNPKTIDELMTYLNDKKNIHIGSESQKKELRYMGYFHGYKGYRYCMSPSSLLPFEKFNEVQAVYDFDMRLKALIYPEVMFLETVLKNYALECTMDVCKSKRFADIFSTALTDYKSYPRGTKKYNNALDKRLKFREHVYSVIYRDRKKSLVSHYYDKDEAVPIWAIFELLSLGEFGNFLLCLDKNIKTGISKAIGIKRSDDSDGRFPEMLVFAIKDLRNAIAYNGVVFDTRFKSSSINNRITAYITKETGITNVNFNSIVDYIVLIAFVLKILGCNQNETISFVDNFEKICEELRRQVPSKIYMRILYSDTRNKLSFIKQFCQKK